VKCEIGVSKKYFCENFTLHMIFQQENNIISFNNDIYRTVKISWKWP